MDFFEKNEIFREELFKKSKKYNFINNLYLKFAILKCIIGRICKIEYIVQRIKKYILVKHKNLRTEGNKKIT